MQISYSHTQVASGSSWNYYGNTMTPAHFVMRPCTATVPIKWLMTLVAALDNVRYPIKMSVSPNILNY